MLICDLAVAWALYVFFKPTDKNKSAIAAWLRVVYALIFGVAIFGLVEILRLVNGADVNETIYPQVLSSMNLFKYGWLVGLEFFGAHLLVLGYLAFKSGYAPKIIGILLIVAALGYFVDTSAQLLMSNYTDYKSIFMPMVALPGVISELSLCFWLLFKGGKK